MFGCVYTIEHKGPLTSRFTEAGVQQRIRLGFANEGNIAWRNNVGALPHPETGQPVRYGLCNDSKKLNQQIKSGDLIGIKRRVITPTDVGSVIGQFWSRECKPYGWQFNPNDAHHAAQLRWIELVTRFGGDAKFSTGGL